MGFVVREAVVDGRVPVLRLALGDSECDVTINNTLPVYTTRLLKAYAEVEGRLAPLVQAVKRWAVGHGLHGEGHLGSYALTLLGIFYAQVVGAVPSLQALGAEELVSPMAAVGATGRTYNVGFARADSAALRSFIAGQQAWPAEVDLAGFWRFYGQEFAWAEEVVAVRVGRRRPVTGFPGLVGASAAETALHIEDPIETDHNLAVFAPGNCAKLRAAMAGEARLAAQRVRARAAEDACDK